jgi:hypothetical protein
MKLGHWYVLAASSLVILAVALAANATSAQSVQAAKRLALTGGGALVRVGSVTGTASETARLPLMPGEHYLLHFELDPQDREFHGNFALKFNDNVAGYDSVRREVFRDGTESGAPYSSADIFLGTVQGSTSGFMSGSADISTATLGDCDAVVQATCTYFGIGNAMGSSIHGRVYGVPEDIRIIDAQGHGFAYTMTLYRYVP